MEYKILLLKNHWNMEKNAFSLEEKKTLFFSFSFSPSLNKSEKAESGSMSLETSCQVNRTIQW